MCVYININVRTAVLVQPDSESIDHKNYY